MRLLITGGAGFIGCNLAARGIRLRCEVTVLDNLSRAGATHNLKWLQSLGKLKFIKADVRDKNGLESLFRSQQFDAIFHQAGQVAVTTSVQDPINDFDVNAAGTLNLLEAIRLSEQTPLFVFASTNKVYGTLSSAPVVESNDRYGFRELKHGVPEGMSLDFHTPYGCSKGAADQYVIDYRRMYGLNSIVFRQSCIYGPRQMGMEDQGWVAWFAICSILDRPITIYGDGKQVRDVLYIDDLVDLYFLAAEQGSNTKLGAYNVGGGSEQAVSILGVIGMLEQILGRKLNPSFSDWRPGDQKIYVSDIRAARRDFDWTPKINPEKGLSLLIDWARQNKELFA